MLEVFIGQTFIQGFDRLDTTAESEAAKFLDSDWEEGDLVQYQNQIADLLALQDREEILTYLDQYGLSFWPVDEDPKAVFQTTLSDVELRLSKRRSSASAI